MACAWKNLNSNAIMRVRNKLLLVMAVPVGLLITQVVLVNVFIRELQSAVDFISSAHKVIEADFLSIELIDSMQKEAKNLPGQYITTQTETINTNPSLRPQWNELASLVDDIVTSSATGLIEPQILNDIENAFSNAAEEYAKTEIVFANDQNDIDTLIERAIFINKALGELSSSLKMLAIELRKQLQVAVDYEKQIHNRPIMAGIIMGGLAVILLVVFTWLYVDRYFVTRLTALSKSMLAIAGGKLHTALPIASGNDEVDEMVEALIIFRDTAVEVEENNLRDIAEARQRLVDAIESISEGFSLYGQDDRLILSNKRYQDLWNTGLEETITPGISFYTVIKNAAQAGLVVDAIGRVDEWVVERMERHKNPSGTFVQRRIDDCWIEVTEYKTGNNGTVAIYTDITAQKLSELALLEEKNRTDQANKLVTEKNDMLESLSIKLSKYLSPQVYSSIFSGRQEVEITSKRKKLTIMFSDIAGFTETADTLESEELTDLLNNYLTEMSTIALKYGATIDKYIGDAIMIFFGDPESKGEQNDATACVNMAIEMQRRMQTLQQEWRDRGTENPFQLRIGINTGYCTVGNFGSADRMDYTIIGNEVNLAARLQSVANLGEILVAHETYALVKDTLCAEERPPVTVKGFSKPVRNYKVIDKIQNGPDENNYSRVNQNGIRATLDLESLTEEEKAETIKTIKKMLSKLEQ